MASTKYSRLELWAHYADVCNVVFDRMPVNGSPYDADCAIALSFGRNSITDYRLPDVRNFYDVFKQDIETMDHISHPYFSGFDPGQANYDIARRTHACVMTYQLPVIIQWEIAMSLYQQSDEAWVKNRYAHQELFYLWPPARPGYRTIEVLEDAFKITQEKGWKRPLLLAHDYHLPRVAMLARHFWPEFIIGFPSITCVFDLASVKPMTASPAAWHIYELKARIHHFMYGWTFGRFKSGRF